jgi:asparagine synthetase B (glutamine-hydrolysing)
MRGFAGLLAKNDSSLALERMAAAMKRRWPDDHGPNAIAEGNRQVALGNKRMEIIDLSPACHRSMNNPTPGDWITFICCFIMDLRSLL